MRKKYFMRRKKSLRKYKNGYYHSDPAIALIIEENDIDTFTEIVRKTFHINPEAMTDEEKKRDANIVKNINKCGWIGIRKRLMDVGESSEHNAVSEEELSKSRDRILNDDWSGMGGTPGRLVKKLIAELESENKNIYNHSYIVPHKNDFIKISDLMNRRGVLSKKFKNACIELGVTPVVTDMHFETIDGKVVSIIDTFNKIFDVIEK